VRHLFAAHSEKSATAASQFIPRLSHEADGLIFQPIDDHYVPGTCDELLKWKFAELNTVDFLFLYNHNNSGSKPPSTHTVQGDVPKA